MRGRKPIPLTLPREHVQALEQIVRRREGTKLVQRRAKILLAVHYRERVGPLADKVDRHRTTVWRLCRRYEEYGLEAVYHGRSLPRQRLLAFPVLSTNVPTAKGA